MVDKKFIQEKYHNYLSKIEQTADGLLYTTDKNLAELFRVKDPSPVNFIKDPRARKYYEVHGKRSNLFTKVGSQYFLPGSVYQCRSREIHPWAKENLYDRQYNAVQELLNFTTKGAILISGTGTGKALHNQEPVLTTDGRKKICDLKIGDFCYGQDGLPKKITGVFPQGLRKLYKVTFGDGTNSICDGDHLRSVSTAHSRNKKENNMELTTLEIKSDPFFIGKNNRSKYAIPLAKPIQFIEKKLPIDPYLLGVLLGDGYLSACVITNPEKEIYVKLSTIVSKANCKLSIWKCIGRCVSYNIIPNEKGGDNSIKSFLDEYGLRDKLSHTKFIPEIFLFGSYDQRLELLKGLMDTDGYIGKGGASYTTCSIKLADNVLYLVRSLGGTATITSRIPKCNGKKGRRSYTISVAISDNPFFLKRKYLRYAKKTYIKKHKSIISIEESFIDYATCIKIDDPSGLFITRDFIVTHNTRCLAGTCYSIGKTVLLTPTDIISNNVVEEFTRFGLHAIKLNGKQKSLPDCDVLVMHISTFKLNYKDLIESGYRNICQDECFVKGTLIDGKPIEKIKVGDYVKSYNHNTNIIEYKRVVNIFKNKVKGNIVELTYSNGKKIICTENHPFRNGFEYSTNKSIDMMLYIINQNNERIIDKLYLVLKKFFMFYKTQTKSLQKTLKNILFFGLLTMIQKKNFIGNCIKNESQICFGKNEEKKSNVGGISQNKNESIVKKNLTQAINTMRKLKMINNTSSKTSIGAWLMEVRICVSNGFAKFKLNISDTLQDRYSKGKINDSHRNRLMKSLSFVSSKTRQKKRGIFTVKRLESIQIQEQTSDGTSGGLCPDGYVYNIEVEDNNNYFVGEGILVHNCHHLSTPLLKLYNLWPGRIYGFTATPSRQEYLLDGFNIAMGKSVDTKITALPVIVRPITYTGKYTVEQAIKAHEGLSPDSYEYIRNLLYQDTTRIGIVNSLIIKLLENGKNKIIVFSDRVDHAKAMYDKFQETQLAKSYLILGEVNDKASLIEEIKTHQQFVIFGTIGCTGEGMDVPMLEVGILTFNSKEERIIQQAVGRVRRKYGEKTCGIFFDIQDSIEIELSRKKYLGGSARNKIYHSLGFDVKEPIGQGTIIGWYANGKTT